MALFLSRHAFRILRNNKAVFQKSSLFPNHLSSVLGYVPGCSSQLSTLGQHNGNSGDLDIAAAGFTNYEEEIKNFELNVPTHYNFCKDVIDKWAAIEEEELKNGAEKGCIKHLGLWFAEERGLLEYKWTYSDLSLFSKRIAYILRNPCALKPGDRVMIMMTSYPQYWLVFLGCIRAGIIVCPCSGFHTAEIIKDHLIQSKAKCLITDHFQVEKVNQIADECPDLKTKIFMPGSRAIYGYLGWLNYADLYRNSKHLISDCADTKSDDTMVMFFTSGTTGTYKLVEHSHASYGLASVINGRYWYDQTRDDITWTLADGAWAKLVWGMLAAWHQGACVFAYHYMDRYAFTYKHFKPEKILKTLESYPVTGLTASPLLWRKLVQEDLPSYTGHSLRHAFSGGEVLNPEVVEKFEAGMGCKLYDGYGQTENSILLGNFKCIPVKKGSLGKPAPGYYVTIIDNEGNELPPGSHGQIAVKVKPQRPPGMFLQYYNDPIKTAQSYVGDYYVTGDIGYCDEDGYFWFISRSEDLLYIGSHVVSPFTVENALMEHGSVAECAVVSGPDHLQLGGQIIKAFVVLSDDYENVDKEELLVQLHEHTRSLLQPHEVPHQVVFVPFLPATTAGKLKRSALRREAWEHIGHLQE